MTALSDAPDVWGEGQLLAFSGIDGPTSWAEPLVLHTASEPGSLDVKLPVGAAVRVEEMPALTFSLVLGDAIVADSGRGPFRLAFLDNGTLAGELPEGIRLAGADDTALASGRPMVLGSGRGLILSAAQRGRRIAIATARDDATGAIGRALSADLDRAIAERSRFVMGCGLPDGVSPGRTRLLRKAASVMKVNTHSPNGAIGRRWSTPDRWPHEHMWLWDSAFQAVGMACLDPLLAQDILLAMLEQAEDSGFLPHTIQPDGRRSVITQPPILAWAALEVLNRGGDTAWAAECLPYLSGYLRWIRENRDQNGNGIPEWYIEGSPLCRSGESGQDNSSAYDEAVLLDAPDFAAYLCNDCRCLGEIARRLDDGSLAHECEVVADSLVESVNAVLWREEEGIYKHRDFDGRFIRPKTAAGLLPLLAGIPDAAQAQALRDHLRDPRGFAAPFPVPSEALGSGTFCKDMWRGPTWININVLIWLGLRRYGLAGDAACLREKTLAEVERWYEATGCLYEYYDALGVTPPHGLDRKQRLVSGQGMSPISDYHWTAAMVVLLLHSGSD